MPSLRELAKQKLAEREVKKKIEDSKKAQEIKPKKVIIPGIEKIPEVLKKAKKTKTQKFKICPKCDKRQKIIGEKDMNRHEMIQWFQTFLIENETNLPSDWLRGQKLTFESVNEMRK